ncbi:hypothetical protein CCMA1212_001495 [Trichoderma ghanense]|uniref:Uncharacterized protein n=1 Tax=Trichoderma ghanense TaxID=65468 RepID=A0ABY2HBU3_9HYPO
MSISEAIAQCLKALASCLEVEQLMEDAWAENQLAYLRLWIADNGASAQSRSCLDRRLESEPDIRRVLADSLKVLAETVDDCRQLGIYWRLSVISATCDASSSDTNGMKDIFSRLLEDNIPFWQHPFFVEWARFGPG